MTDVTTKIVILNAPVAGGSAGEYLWWDNTAKGSGVTDSLGNYIEAV
jgi:hypothetical protein